MNPQITFRVPSKDSQKRLDVFLSQEQRTLSRSQIKRLIAQGNVQVGGRKAKAGMKLKENDAVTLHLPELQAADALAQPIPLVLLYEDRHLLVVDKPAGLVVHPGAGNPSGTLVNALDQPEYRRTLGEQIGGRARSRLFEMCTVIKMPLIEDYRLRKAKKF